MIGTTVGPYRVLDKLGAGGMGEVYRARDTKLGREVAVKILPDVFVADPERVARFEREAQLLAALNHPNIAAIYGFEDSGSVHALALERVEGPTLADRVAHGPIALEEALAIAKQIADALEAAHDRGIVHRDLKPANVKVRADGAVKVLDFGLARAFDPSSAGRSSEDLARGATHSPTITTPALMTGAGVVLGTAAYMAPEQARGRAVDKRADIWAFGCVLYEMLTGRRAFDGDEVSDVLASVLKSRMGWPDVLPGGRSVLVTVEVNASTQVAILDLESEAKKTLIRNATRARYLPPGQVVYAASGRLWAVPFDLSRQEISGQALPLPESVLTKPGEAALSPQNDLVSVAIRPGDQFQFGSPAVVLKNVINPDVSVGRSYDVAPDGQRFLFIHDKSEADAANRDLAIGIVLNWQQGLKARLPSDK
jgi:serine/threonine protein kinase